MIQRVLGSVKQALAETPPELAQDLLEMGIHLVGGGGMLRGFDRRIEHETGVPVRMSDMPLETVVLGAGRCLLELGRDDEAAEELRAAREAADAMEAELLLDEIDRLESPEETALPSG